MRYSIEALAVLSPLMSMYAWNFDLGEEQETISYRRCVDPDMRARILIGHCRFERDGIFRCIGNWAHRAFSLNIVRQHLATAIRAVIQGELWVEEKIIQQMADALQGDHRDPAKLLRSSEKQCSKVSSKDS